LTKIHLLINQIAALIPYHFHNRELPERKTSAVWDITLMATYSVYQTKRTVPFLHTIYKMPTGNSIIWRNQKFPTGNPKLALFLPNIWLRRKTWDWIVCWITTSRPRILRNKFGNQLNYGSTLFLSFRFEDRTAGSQIGIAGEVYENKQYGEKVINTAGYSFSKFGLEVGKDKFSVGINDASHQPEFIKGYR
jgi:hypothetical protein